MIIKLLNNQQWDELLLIATYHSPYLKWFWYQLIEKHVGGKFYPLFVDVYEKQYLVPCFVNLPWSQGVRIGAVGYGGPVCLTQNHYFKDVPKIIQGIRDYFQIDCTGGVGYPLDDHSLFSIQNGKNSATYLLNITCGIDCLFDSVYTGNIRTCIRKAKKSGVIIEEISESNVEQAWNLLKKTQHDVGASYQTSFPFFCDLALYNKTNSRGYIAIYQKEIVSTSILLFSKHEAAHYLHGWNRSYSHLCANQMLINHMINVSITMACKIFNFGESNTDDLKKAKTKWGAKEYYVLRWST